MKNRLDAKYEKLICAIDVLFIERFAISADYWTEIHCKRSYLGATLHYQKDHDIVSTVIAVEELKDRHTSEYLQPTIRHILEVNKLDIDRCAAIVTDNGRNILQCRAQICAQV